MFKYVSEHKSNLNMMHQTSKKKKFMGKMSDIIRKELQSESDDYMDDEEEDSLEVCLVKI